MARDTQPHYGGNRVIWDALKAAAEADLETAKVIIESAGIIITHTDMTVGGHAGRLTHVRTLLVLLENAATYNVPLLYTCLPELPT